MTLNELWHKIVQGISEIAYKLWYEVPIEDILLGIVSIALVGALIAGGGWLLTVLGRALGKIQLPSLKELLTWVLRRK